MHQGDRCAIGREEQLLLLMDGLLENNRERGIEQPRLRIVAVLGDISGAVQIVYQDQLRIRERLLYNLHECIFHSGPQAKPDPA